MFVFQAIEKQVSPAVQHPIVDVQKPEMRKKADGVLGTWNTSKFNLEFEATLASKGFKLESFDLKSIILVDDIVGKNAKLFSLDLKGFSINDLIADEKSRKKIIDFFIEEYFSDMGTDAFNRARKIEGILEKAGLSDPFKGKPDERAFYEVLGHGFIKAYIFTNIDSAQLKNPANMAILKKIETELNININVSEEKDVEKVKKANPPIAANKKVKEIPLEVVVGDWAEGRQVALLTVEARNAWAEKNGFSHLIAHAEQLAETSYKLYFSSNLQTQQEKGAFIAQRKSQAAKEGEKRIKEDQDKEKSTYASQLHAVVSGKLADAREQTKKERNAEEMAKNAKKAKKPRSSEDYQQEYKFIGPGST